MPAKAIAYLAEGKLYLHDFAGGQLSAGGPRLVESPFAQGILDRVERDRDRNSWKSDGMGWNLRAGGMVGMLGMPAVPVETRNVRFTGVAEGGGNGRLLYALDAEHVGGLFCRDLVEDHEQRLLHRRELRATDVSRRPSDGMLALSLRMADGTSHLAVMSAEGRGLKQVTEGDAVDESPSWSDDGRTIVFQSAGIGRNAQGFMAALSSYAVQELDLDGGSVSTVLEADAHDFLLPKRVGDALYFIRRPYQPHGPPVSPWKVATDVLLFPWRLAVALVHLLNFISLMFARKPLMTAGGPPRQGADQRFLMLWGRVIDAQKMAKKGGGGERGSGALVPKDWQLVRRDASGNEQTLAEQVVAYDVGADGSIVYTNGTRVMARESGEAGWREVVRGKLIERVVFIS